MSEAVRSKPAHMQVHLSDLLSVVGLLSRNFVMLVPGGLSGPVRVWTCRRAVDPTPLREALHAHDTRFGLGEMADANEVGDSTPNLRSTTRLISGVSFDFVQSGTSDVQPGTSN